MHVVNIREGIIYSSSMHKVIAMHLIHIFSLPQNRTYLLYALEDLHTVGYRRGAHMMEVGLYIAIVIMDI